MALPLSQQQRADRRAAEAAYRASVEKQMKLWREHQDHQMRLIRDDVMVYQRHVVAAMADVTEWDAHRIEQVNKMLDQARSELYKRMNHNFETIADETAALALDSIDKPLSAFGVNIGSVGRQLPIAQMNYLRGVTPSLIQNVTATVHAEVQQLLYTHAHGGMTKQELLKKIGAATGPLNGPDLKPGQVIPRAEVRARTIFRTETNRMASIIQQDRLEQFAKRDKGVGSRWIHWPSQQPRHDHTALHGQVIFRGHDEFFHLDGLMITGPHDPRLPASQVINCHCKVVVTYDPDKSEDQTDPVIASAPAGTSAPAATPVVTPQPKAAAKPKPPAPKATALTFKDLPARPAVGATRAENEAHLHALFGVDDATYPVHQWTARPNAASLDKLMKPLSDDSIRGLAHAMHDVAEECRARGLPMLNALGPETNPAYAASVTGNELRIGSNVLNKLGQYGQMLRDPHLCSVRATAALESIEADIAAAIDAKAAPEFIAQLREYRTAVAAWDGASACPAPVSQAWCSDQTRLARFYRADGLVQSGFPGVSRPQVGIYGLPDYESAMTTIWHEFGHHIHNATQYARTGVASDYFDWSGAAGEHYWTGGEFNMRLHRFLSTTRKPEKFCTTYAERGGKKKNKGMLNKAGGLGKMQQRGTEWFAENFSAWRSGYIDLVEPDFIAFCKAEGIIL